MNQQSISQSTDNENGSPERTIVSAKFRNELKKVLQDLNELRAKPTPIYHGNRQRRIDRPPLIHSIK